MLSKNNISDLTVNSQLSNLPCIQNLLLHQQEQKTIKPTSMAVTDTQFLDAILLDNDYFMVVQLFAK